MYTGPVHMPSANNSLSTVGQPAGQHTGQLVEPRCVGHLTRTNYVAGPPVTAYSFAERHTLEQGDTSTSQSTADEGSQTLAERAVFCYATKTVEVSSTVATVVETPVQPSYETKVVPTTEVIPMTPAQTNGMTQATPTASTTLTTVATVVTPETTATDVTTHDGVVYKPETTISTGAAQRVRPGFWR